MRTIVAKWLILGFIASHISLYADDPAAADSKKTALEPLLSWHFLGQNNLAKRRDISTFRHAWEKPESKALVDLAISKIALYSARRIADPAQNKNLEQLPPLIEPLFFSLLADESAFELRRSGERGLNWILALKGEKDNLWSTNLWRLADLSEMGKPAPNPSNKNPGWSVRDEAHQYQLSLWVEKGWTIVAGGTSLPTEGDRFLKNLPGKTPGEYLLKANLDLPSLGAAFNAKKFSRAPKTTLTVTPRGENIRSEMSLHYPADLKIQIDPWLIPTNLIHDPLINGNPGLNGFSAMRGVGPLLARNEQFKSLEPQKIPNQLYFWSDSVSPFSIHMAADVGNPRELISKFVRDFVPGLTARLQRLALGNIQYDANAGSVTWKGLPVVFPFLTPAPASDKNYLLGGLFPIDVESKNPAPPELFSQVLRQKNLLYYEWEVTEPRLAQWRPMNQLYSILTLNSLPSPQSAGEQWLNAIQPLLGNTITELSSEGPAELKWVRSSHIGFNALELILLGRWFDNDEFPNWSRKSSSSQNLSAPPAATSHKPKSVGNVSPPPLTK